MAVDFTAADRTKLEAVAADYARRSGDYATSDELAALASAVDSLPDASSGLTPEQETQLTAIAAKVGLLGSGKVVAISPVLNGGKSIFIVRGDDYLSVDGREFVFNSDSWPDLSGADLTLRIAKATAPGRVAS